MAHTWRITVPDSKIALTLWVDKVSAELEGRGQGSVSAGALSTVGWI